MSSRPGSPNIFRSTSTSTGGDYTLDYDNWGGTPFEVGVTVITSNGDLGLRLLARLGTAKWTSGNKYSRVIE